MLQAGVMTDRNKASERPDCATHYTTGPDYIKHLTHGTMVTYYPVHTQHSNEFVRLEKNESFQERWATGCIPVQAQKEKKKGANISRKEKRS